jgi:hypothetical protein
VIVGLETPYRLARAEPHSQAHRVNSPIQPVVRVSKLSLLTTGFALIYTPTYQRQFVCSLIHVTNGAGSPTTVQVCVVAPGSSPGIGNALMWTFSIPSNDLIELAGGLILLAGWSIQALASANNVATIIVSGEEF